ncbi:MAG: sulfate/molybdate ABC transporter ATP-binding protein [Janthinobacterium lividum]
MSAARDRALTDPVASGLDVAVRYAPRSLALDLRLAPGEVLAVLGPNGAGKSSTLGLLAGLLRPTAGRILLDADVLTDVGAGRFLPAHRRGVALLAQEALLFPHLTVAANVAFGPRSSGASRAGARAAATSWLDAVGMGEFAGRRPHQLSGGQAQRVAIARALAAQPRLLLLDEPLAALDVGAAPEVRQVLRRVLRGDGPSAGRRSAVLVTHDLLDALALADQVVILESGRIAERGPLRQVLSHPRSAFGAQIAGLVLVTGWATPSGLRTPDGTEVAGLVEETCAPGDDAVAVFSPSAVAVHASDPGGSPRNRWRATVTDLAPRGDLVRVRAVRGDLAVLADVTPAAAAELDLMPGVEVHLAVKASAVHVHTSASPADTR